MKIWLLIITLVYLQHPGEKLSSPSPEFSVDGGHCLSHYCVTVSDDKPFYSKEACEKDGSERANKNSDKWFGVYKCVELEIKTGGK
jgi:hypothetical protein